MKPIIFENRLSPGDTVCMTAAIRDLHINHPNKYMTEVRTTGMPIWEHNRYITKINREKDEVKVDGDNAFKNRNEIYKAWRYNKVPRIKLHYPLIHSSNRGPQHFTEGYTDYIERILGIRIRDRIMKGHIELSDNEKLWISQVEEIIGCNDRFWIIVNGGKMDFTAKWWDPVRMQRVVNSLPELLFVQVGNCETGGKFPHNHIRLRGDNVINLLNETNMRQLIRLVYHSSGIICPVTMLMHLAAAVPVNKERCYWRDTRPCVVLAGGREPPSWEAYNYHTYLHLCGVLSCCASGGCWKSRVVPVNDGYDDPNSMCLMPETTENGIIIPKCLKMIEVADVIKAVKRYII